MAIDLVDNFNLTVPKPLDGRDVVADLTARDAIPLGIRYPGMPVHVIDSDGAGLAMNYQLVGGTGNINWVEFAGGGGGGISEWVAATLYKVDAQVIFNNKIYKCTNEHTSSVAFATDLANWSVILTDAIKVIEVSSDYTVDLNIEVVLVNIGVFLSPVTITLPSAALYTKILRIKKIHSDESEVTITPSDPIDGLYTYALTRQYDSISIVSNGSDAWSII